MLSRRSFLARSGATTLGLPFSSAVLLDFLGTRAFAREAGDDALHFGALEPLVAAMSETAPAELLSVLVGRLRSGVELKTLVAAGALANARAFGGEDYDGYHCFMALMPAFAMAQRSQPSESALPVLKVLHRSTARMAAFRASHPRGVLAQALPVRAADPMAIEALAAAVRSSDAVGADHAFAAIAGQGRDAALLALAPLVREEMDVHRVVLAWRAYETLAVAGNENAATLLRQCVHFCAAREKDAVSRNVEVRELVPRLVQEHRLAGRAIASDGLTATAPAIEQLGDTFFQGRRADAAGAMARALAAGWSVTDVGEALSLAATRLLLADHGVAKNPSLEKPLGSVHGASIGVHASDSAHAWRHLACTLPATDRAATLVAAAYHTGGQAGWLGEPFSFEKELADLSSAGAADSLARLESAIAAANQPGACAAAAHHLATGGSGDDLVRRLLPFAVADDGALHAEKYFLTASDLYTTSRPEFRDRHLVALARVAASQHVKAADSVVAARALLAGKG